MGSPKLSWDHCLELEALVHSCTSKDIYMTAGQVPETIMTGSTTNMSHIAEFGWYDWVMYCDNIPIYPWRLIDPGPLPLPGHPYRFGLDPQNPYTQWSVCD